MAEHDEQTELNGIPFNELAAQADSGELTPEALQEQLNAYSRALEEEFKIAAEKKPESVDSYTKDFFTKHVPMSAAQIVWLSQNSTSDAVRASTCKYILEQAMKEEKAQADPVAALLAKLAKNDKKPQPVAGDNITT